MLLLKTEFKAESGRFFEFLELSCFHNYLHFRNVNKTSLLCFQKKKMAPNSNHGIFQRLSDFLLVPKFDQT